MADRISDPQQAGERLLQFAREGRLAQGTWLAKQDGREVACLLGAAAGITDADECPASLMPKWVAHALPSLFDGQTPAHAETFARRWGDAMMRSKWARIDWDAVRDEWMAFLVAQAQDNARVAADARAAAAAARVAAWAADDASDEAAADAAKAAAWAAYAVADDDAAPSAAARNAQADALMSSIERAIEVARG